MKRPVLILMVALMAVLAGALIVETYRRSAGGAPRARSAPRYYCPMHPTYASDKPGDCPICNMKLVPMEEERAGGSAASGVRICLLHNCKMANCPMELPLKPGETVTCPVCGTHVAPPAAEAGRVLYYRHPMRPEVTSPTPGKDEMGMDYVPVYAEEGQPEVPVPGQATTTITPERRELIGMRTDVVGRRPLATTVRASGRVAYDPDLYNAMAEYREAVRARAKVKDSPWPDVHERSDALVRASKLRLRQLGLSEGQISEAGRSEQPPTNLILGGGGGAVWVYAQIYEYEIGMVKPGQSAEITSPAFRGRKFRGVVKAVDPMLSAETRSLKVRIEVPNPDELLKLEMYVNAVIQVDLGEKLALPESAVLDTGERQLVFVDLGNGRIEPREVQTGREAGGFYELLSGVREGERVVTAANFLIDSESKLKSAFTKSGAAEPAKEEKGEKPPSQEHRH